MHQKELLCIASDRGMASGYADALRGWKVHVVGTLGEAHRALCKDDYLVGLLVGLDEVEHTELDHFLSQNCKQQWIGLLQPATLASASWRQLVGDHFYDFHTAPVDPVRLDHALGHALGVARLRAPAVAPVAAPAAAAMIGNSAAIRRLRAQISRVAPADAPVFIGGESGSGKELAARAVHAQSPRCAGPFVPVNCGSLAPTLIQSELFGHARGAFTGAAADKAGLIETASGGTLFLDEVAELPKDQQANLLRFLQEKTIYRVGSTRSIAVDVRVIAASHVDLQRAVERGLFREDLYYRLNVLPLAVPPLRERCADVPVLAEHFFSQHAADKPQGLKGFSSAALQALRQHDWPGNVRELINRTRRAMVLAEGRLITPADLGLADAGRTPGGGAALDESRFTAERAAIMASLERAGNNLSRAARDLGVSRMTLYRLLDKHGIPRKYPRRQPRK